MSLLKPKLFIGSSRSNLSIAEKVKSYLSSNVDCSIWNSPEIWEINQSTFDNLLRCVSYFDFGLFIATADDWTLTKDKIVIEPRDNVILEMALFCGALGRDKSFLMVEEGIKLPTDFDGIYMPYFKKEDEKSIQSACDAYSKRITQHYRLGYLSLYPTTALAIGYYKNFISGLVERINEAEEIIIDGKRYSDFKLKVVLPKDLKGNIRERATLFYKRNNLLSNSLNTKYRPYPSWFMFDAAQAPQAFLYDMPTTLTGIDDAIELILQKTFHGRTNLQEIIEQRELSNFKRVLKMQIDKSPFAQEIVEIIDEF